MGIRSALTQGQSFFAIFCIEALADRLKLSGNAIYLLLSEKSDIFDGYIIPNYEALHTQGKEYIVDDLIAIMDEKGILG